MPRQQSHHAATVKCRLLMSRGMLGNNKQQQLSEKSSAPFLTSLGIRAQWCGGRADQSLPLVSLTQARHKLATGQEEGIFKVNAE